MIHLPSSVFRRRPIRWIAPIARAFGNPQLSKSFRYSAILSGVTPMLEGSAGDVQLPPALVPGGPRSSPVLHLRERLRGVAEAAGADAHSRHQREVEAAHLAVGFVAVVEDAAGLDAPAAAAEEDDRQL